MLVGLCVGCNLAGVILDENSLCIQCVKEPNAKVKILLKTKDDGTRDKYLTGAVRSSHKGRGRYDLVSPIGLRRLAIRYEAGSLQKGDRNWELGFPISRAICSAIGHLMEYLEGDRKEDHLAAVAWQMFAAMHFEEKVEKGEMDREFICDTPVKVK